MKTAKRKAASRKPVRRAKSRSRARRHAEPRGEFFQSKTLEELAREQGVGPLTDPSVLAGAWPEDEDLDAFLEETYRSR